MVSKANSQLGLLIRSFVIRDKTSTLLLYKSTIRPILEYGCIVWSPWKKKLIDHIEKVQHRFTKLIDGMEGLTYEHRLVSLQLTTLQHRKKRERLIQAFKLLHNMNNADYSTFFDKASGSTTRGHSWKLKTTHSRINCRANFFSANVVGNWNSLQETVVNSTSLNKFKGSLKPISKCCYGSQSIFGHIPVTSVASERIFSKCGLADGSDRR